MSTIRVDNFAPSAGGTEFGIEGIAKAGVKFQDDATISDSYNVSSLTDNGTGDFSFSMTNEFANTNYTQAGIVQSTNDQNMTNGPVSVSDFNVRSFNSGGGADDVSGSAHAWGDLA